MTQGCSQDVKSQDRDETETVNPQDETRPRRSIFSKSQDRDETETFNPQDRDETRRSKKTSRDRLETETFKTKTTSLLYTPASGRVTHHLLHRLIGSDCPVQRPPGHQAPGIKVKASASRVAAKD